ncbi:hypothetical protein ACLB2K_060922 [Fragaria x ananassa]
MAQEIATLPASVALRRYGGKILQYVHEDVETHGLLVADGDDVMSALCKLEVLPARSGNGRVHIRCSYNNKFLALRGEGDSVVAPVAEQPVEDESAWGCTMFVPSYIFHNSNRDVQLLHVQRGRNLFIDQQNHVLEVSEQVPAHPQTAYHMIFSFTDLVPLFMMPRHVAFKGDNGQYLRFMTISNQPFLQFSSAVDKWHPSVLQEVENDYYGYAENRFRIKCHISNVRDGYWRRNRDSDPEWIHADSVLLPHHSPVSHRWGDSIFRAAKVGESAEGIIVAFRSTNDNHLMRGSASNVQNVLRAAASTIVVLAHVLSGGAMRLGRAPPSLFSPSFPPPSSLSFSRSPSRTQRHNRPPPGFHQFATTTDRPTIDNHPPSDHYQDSEFPTIRPPPRRCLLQLNRLKALPLKPRIAVTNSPLI